MEQINKINAPIILHVVFRWCCFRGGGREPPGSKWQLNLKEWWDWQKAGEGGGVSSEEDGGQVR